MLHIYSKLTPLTPKSLFPQLGLLGPFIRLNSPHKALVTSTILSKLNWDGKRGRVEKEVENSQTLILHLKESGDICMLNHLHTFQLPLAHPLGNAFFSKVLRIRPHSPSEGARGQGR
jgi:hypothetical protein